MIFKKSILLISCILLPILCHAQTPSNIDTSHNTWASVFQWVDQMDIPSSDPYASEIILDTTPNTLYLHISGDAFLRDAEYFLHESKGYTVSGFRLSPTLQYNLNERTLVRAGLRMTTVAGYEPFWELNPLLAIDYQATEWMRIVMGTLYGSTRHKLGAPMYDPERWFYDYQEDGLQILTHAKRWESDTWLNWENFLEAWTPDQERFTLGSRHSLDLYKSRADGHLLIDAAFVGCHRGGQFSTLDTCIETLFNENIGLRWESRCLNGDYARISIPFYFFQNASPHPYTTYLDGWGIHPTIGLRASNPRHALSTEIGYWYGSHYISPRGSYLFQSVSWFDPSFASPTRKMITAQVAYAHHFKGLTLNLGTQFYYDLDEKALDFAIGLTMGFRESFKLK